MDKRCKIQRLKHTRNPHSFVTISEEIPPPLLKRALIIDMQFYNSSEQVRPVS
jgi:hypothetical protein